MAAASDSDKVKEITKQAQTLRLETEQAGKTSGESSITFVAPLAEVIKFTNENYQQFLSFVMSSLQLDFANLPKQLKNIKVGDQFTAQNPIMEKIPSTFKISSYNITDKSLEFEAAMTKRSNENPFDYFCYKLKVEADPQNVEQVKYTMHVDCSPKNHLPIAQKVISDSIENVKQVFTNMDNYLTAVIMGGKAEKSIDFFGKSTFTSEAIYKVSLVKVAEKLRDKATSSGLLGIESGNYKIENTVEEQENKAVGEKHTFTPINNSQGISASFAISCIAAPQNTSKVIFVQTLAVLNKEVPPPLIVAELGQATKRVGGFHVGLNSFFAENNKSVIQDLQAEKDKRVPPEQVVLLSPRAHKPEGHKPEEPRKGLGK